ncbi:hypothetical protein V6N13_060444 [Hibiscus sabdariffa]|uniref:Uncharacterized protein n=1 Tax=Hibiscus sabdariffa TaxID=183260 RepID=A0ABR2GB45_9ROSI
MIWMHFFDLFTSLSLPFPRLLAYEDKSAYALSAFSFALGPDVEPVTFLQKTPSVPYFPQDRDGNTVSCAVFPNYAEMPKEEKNKTSHRSRALDMVKSHFAEAGYNFTPL